MSVTSLLSVIIPVYNEQGNVELLTDAIDLALKDYKSEIIFVDDYSTDNTRMEIKDLSHSNVVLIEMKKNYGQSAALQAGIDYANGAFIITMDGDMQNDPSDIPMMLDLLIEGD